MSVLVALVAAFLFALGVVLQQRAALDEPDEAVGPGFVLRLVKRPVWLVGITSDILGAIAQAAALGMGRLLVVQPLLASYVIFALPLGYVISHQQVSRRAILSAAAVAAGLTGFLLLSSPGGGAGDAPLTDWVVAAVAVIAACAALMTVAKRFGPARRAAFRGAAAGLTFALSAALIKQVVTVLEAQGVQAMLSDWHFYAAVAVAIATITLNQIALQAGALAPAITASVMLNAVGSVLLGYLLFNEQLEGTSTAVIGSFVCLALMFGGVLVLAGEEVKAPVRNQHDP
ncbi:MAG: hypothetical protein QOG62_662 [Thermoleophilaceae bacterium]|nr:hypothetical protein [Thermoleophilaceae bacterium]